MKEIDYSEIINLGFEILESNDNVYFNRYGFPYCIITKKLTDLIYIQWHKETRLCEMVRIDDILNCNILATMPINDLEHLNQMIDFFTNKAYTYTAC